LLLLWPDTPKSDGCRSRVAISAVVFAGGLNLISVMSKHVKACKKGGKSKKQTHQNLTSQPPAHGGAE